MRRSNVKWKITAENALGHQGKQTSAISKLATLPTSALESAQIIAHCCCINIPCPTRRRDV
jgi:hypothetical protein